MAGLLPVCVTGICHPLTCFKQQRSQVRPYFNFDWCWDTHPRKHRIVSAVSLQTHGETVNEADRLVIIFAAMGVGPWSKTVVVILRGPSYLFFLLSVSTARFSSGTVLLSSVDTASLRILLSSRRAHCSPACHGGISSSSGMMDPAMREESGMEEKRRQSDTSA